MKCWWCKSGVSLWQVMSLWGCLNAIAIQPGLAGGVGGEKISNLQNLEPMLSPKILQLSEIEHPSRDAQKLVQSPTPQTAPALVVQVTSVKANPTNQGLEVILQTSIGEKSQIINRSAGNSFIADISNAQLRLPNGDAFAFRSQEPIAGITEITVTNQNANTIRVTVVGTTFPTVEVFDSPDEGLIFSVKSAASTQQGQPSQTQQKPEAISGTGTQRSKPSVQGDEPIELVVTGERDGYRVPDASTATRTDTPIRDIPQSIQVVPRQVLQDQQVTRLDEALRNVSGVIGSSTEGAGFQFSLRGFQYARTLRDGFRLSGSDSLGNTGILTLPETANIERIEVLKGPASILYGEVQPGGVINLVTKKPTSQPFFEGELQIGNRNFIRPRIDISDSLTADGHLSYRLNALIQQDEGFRNFNQNIERQFIAPVVSWKVGDRTDLTLDIEYFHDQRPNDTGLLAFGRGVIDVPRDRIVNEPDDVTEKHFLTTGYTLEHRFSENWRIRNAFRFSKQDFNSNVFIPLRFDEATGRVTRTNAATDWLQESYGLQTDVVGKFETGSIKHTLLFGVDLSRNTSDLLTRADFTLPSFLNIFAPVYNATRRSLDTLPQVARDQKVTTSRLGVFLQDQIALADNFKLLAGLRYDTVEQNLTNGASLFSRGVSSETTQNNDALTPRVGIVYQPIPALSLYANYARSFTPNTATTYTGDFLEPEKSEGFEVGLKAELLQSRLLATLAYFDITKQNVATADTARDPSGTSGFFVATGEQRSQGVEFDLSGDILPGWKIIASYAYTDARVTADNNPKLIRNRLVGIPRHSAGLWTTYTLGEGNLQGLGFGIGFNYASDRQGDLNNSFVLNNYFVTNAAIFYQRDRWRLAVNFKNIFDVNYIQGTPISRIRNIEVGEPFTVIGSISIRF